MKNFFEQLKSEGHKIRLSAAEKTAMRARILGVPSTIAAPSPYFFFDFQFMQRAFVPLLAVLVILGGTGTAYAAEGSLPGDPLYAVKIAVTEPVRAALATSAEARAEVHIALAERRVEEAEALAADGRLSATTTAELEENFEAHVAKADALAAQVGQDDPAGAVEIKARANSSLAVHGAILATLSKESRSGDSKTNSSRLATRVLARVTVVDKIISDKARAASKTVIPTVPPSSGMQIQAFAVAVPSDTATATAESQSTVEVTKTEGEEDNLKTRAEEAFKAAREQYKNAKEKFSAKTTSELDKQFANIEIYLASGDTTAALMLALKLQVILKAQAKFRGDVIGPLLELRSDNNRD